MSELEFKYDSRDDKYKLLDMNPRFWSWHSLAGRAGADLPYLVWQIANDQAVEEVHARGGFEWVHMVADLLAAAQEISRGRISAGD